MANSQDLEKTPYASLQQSDRDVTAIPRPAQKSRSNWERLGTFNIVVLILGTVAIFLAIAFLTFFWYISINQPLTGKQPPLWVGVVREGWTSRVVTLGTVLIRTAVAAQLAVFAAILAALILERAGTSAIDFPKLSMIRCANSGPQALIWHVLHSLTDLSQIGYTILIIVAILNALALQFTSTILLADFNDGAAVILGERVQQTPWGFSETVQNSILAGSDFWKTAHTEFPTFAEYKEKASHGSDYADTGRTYRGLIPFADSAVRQSLRAYNGPMSVIDERAVCVKPKLSNVTFHTIQIQEDQAWADFTLGGTISLNGSHPDVIQANPEPFNCTVPSPGRTEHTWQVVLCALPSGYSALLGGILNDHPQRTDTSLGFDVSSTLTWMFLNLSAPMNFDYEQWQPIELEGRSLSLPELKPVDGAWSYVGYSNASIAMSYCIMHPVTAIYNVTSYTSVPTVTEIDTIYFDPELNDYETYSARSQLGALDDAFYAKQEGKTLQEQKGLMNLDNVGNWSDVRIDTKKDQAQKWLEESLAKVGAEESLDQAMGQNLILYQNGGQVKDMIHRTHRALAQSILQNTTDPALTIQSLAHVVMQTAYYELLTSFNLNDTSIHTETDARNIPVTWNHFAGVNGMLILHLFLILLAVILFLTKTEMSLLGNAWQAVAQVHSHDTAQTFQHAYMTTDKELEASAKNTGIASGSIWIRKSDINGRQEAVAVHRGR